MNTPESHSENFSELKGTKAASSQKEIYKKKLSCDSLCFRELSTAFPFTSMQQTSKICDLLNLKYFFKFKVHLKKKRKCTLYTLKSTLRSTQDLAKLRFHFVLLPISTCRGRSSVTQGSLYCFLGE